MNYQEARRMFSEKISDMTIRIADPAIRKDHVKVWKTIIELYETAIDALAMIPEYEELKKRNRAVPPFIEFDGCGYSCPECNVNFNQDKWTYCPGCGQRIDWTEQEEDHEN